MYHTVVIVVKQQAKTSTSASGGGGGHRPKEHPHPSAAADDDDDNAASSTATKRESLAACRTRGIGHQGALILRLLRPFIAEAHSVGCSSMFFVITYHCMRTFSALVLILTP